MYMGMLNLIISKYIDFKKLCPTPLAWIKRTAKVDFANRFIIGE